MISTDQLCSDLLDAVDKMTSSGRHKFKADFEQTCLLAYWSYIGKVKTTEQAREMLQYALHEVKTAQYAS